MVTDDDEECREEARLVLPIRSRTEIESEARRILRTRFFFYKFYYFDSFFSIIIQIPSVDRPGNDTCGFLNMYVILGNYFYFVIIIIS